MIQKFDTNYHYFTGGILIRNDDMLNAAINLRLKISRKNKESKLMDAYNYQTEKWTRCANITCEMAEF